MTLKTPVVELERRLSTERVMDIFTMQPKVGIVTYLNAERLTKHGILTDFFLSNLDSKWAFLAFHLRELSCFRLMLLSGSHLGRLGRKSIHHRDTFFLANGLVPPMQADSRRRKS